jgi:hypothetical protein
MNWLLVIAGGMSLMGRRTANPSAIKIAPTSLLSSEGRSLGNTEWPG